MWLRVQWRREAIVAGSLFVLALSYGCDVDSKEIDVEPGAARARSPRATPPRESSRQKGPKRKPPEEERQERPETPPDDLDRVELDPPTPRGAEVVRLFETDEGFGLSWVESRKMRSPDRASVDRRELPSVYSLAYAEWTHSGWSRPETVVESRDLDWHANPAPSVRPGGGSTYLANWLQDVDEPSAPSRVQMTMRSSDAAREWAHLDVPTSGRKGRLSGPFSILSLDNETISIWSRNRAVPPTSSATDAGPLLATTGGLPTCSETDEEPAESALLGNEFVVLDEEMCRCCGMDAARTSGSVIVAFRGADGDSMDGVRTIHRRGGEWSEPTTQSEHSSDLPPCKRNGLAVAADGEKVTLAWLDYQGTRGRIKAALSQDGGRTFGDPIVVAGGDEDGGPIGRLDATYAGDHAVVSWVRAGEGIYREPYGISCYLGFVSGRFRLRPVEPTGELERAMDVGPVVVNKWEERPQIATTARHLIAAWYDTTRSEPVRVTALPKSTVSKDAIGAGGRRK